MWIEEIFINHFGAWRQLRLSGLEPGFNLIVGPNEAGKSTILEFVRSVIVGFGKRNVRANSYEPPNGAMRAGWILVREPGGEQLRFERVERQGCKNGVLTVFDADGCMIEGSGIPGLQDGLETAVLDTLFAFDLDRMRQLDQKALRAKIVATALGSVETNPLDVIKLVEERLKLLSRRSGGDGKSLAALQAQIREVDNRLKAVAELPDKYESLRKESEAASIRLREAARGIKTREEALLGLHDILACEEPWKRLLSLDREIARLEDTRHFPPDGLVRLERGLERRREITDNLIETQNALDHLSLKLEGLLPDPKIAANLEAIETLSRRAAAMTDLPATIDKTAGEIAESVKKLEEHLSSLGIGWNLHELAKWLPSMDRVEEIRSLSQSCLDCADRIRGLEMRLQESSQRIARGMENIDAARNEAFALEEQVAGYLDGSARRKLQTCLEAGQTVRHLQDRLSDKNDAVQKLIRERQDVLAGLKKLESHGKKGPSSTWFLVLVLVSATVGTGLLFIWSQHAEVPAYLTAGVGICLLGSIFALAGRRFYLQRVRRAEVSEQRQNLLKTLSRCQAHTAAYESQRRSLIVQMTALQSEARARAQEVLGHPDAGHHEILAALETAEATEEPFGRLARIEETLKSHASQIETERKYRTQIAGTLREAGDEMSRFHDRLTGLFREMDLPFEGHPATAPEFIGRLQDLAAQARQITGEEARLAGMKRSWEAFVDEVQELAQEIGSPLQGGKSPLAEANHWARVADQIRNLLARRDATVEQIGEHQCRLEALLKKRAEAQAAIDSLFQVAGVADEEAFRECGRRRECLDRLAQERAGILDRLAAQGAWQDETELFGYLAQCDWERIRQDRRLLQSEIEALRTESQELAGREGRLHQEIETLERGEETERLLTQRELLLAELEDAINEWTRLRLASVLLEKTLRVYELEKQPRVLERSSEIFSQITDGAFSGILFPLTEDRVKAVRPDGSRLDEAVLSRGTLEQMYLAVRLAYLEVYRPKGLALPLLMDDVLVNFDSRRAGNAAQVLMRFSRETNLQVLFFTCHPHIADLFSGNVVEVQLGSEEAIVDATCHPMPAAGACLP